MSKTLSLAILSLALIPACVADTETESEVVSEVANYHADGVFGASMEGGWASVDSYANEGGTFSANICVFVHRATPNTTYTLQRAPEIGRPLAADGICQRADGLAPWGPPAPAFPTFAVGGVPVTLTTNEGGNGKTCFEFHAPGIARGVVFDVAFRAIDLSGGGAPSVVSECFTVTVQ